MKKRILRYLKHIGLTILTLFIAGFIAVLYVGGAVHYSDHPLQYKMINEGPYLFYENDSTVSVNYINGSRPEGGYTINTTLTSIDSMYEATCFFPLDSTSFEFEINNTITTPSVTYSDNGDILAVSDIESGYKTFRDFLISNNVINQDLEWTFGNGHLVLLGDFVDRGNSTTQVLWFIYRLEQEAQKYGGQVHFIIGNHELKNFQGNFESASDKYFRIASVLGKLQHELYDKDSFSGRWMASKNAVEMINGNLFVHGGLHPDLANSDLSLDQIAMTLRENYYKIFYPKPSESDEERLLSTQTGPCWYRGYYREDVSQTQIDKLLAKFEAKSIVVGHTLQSNVNRIFNGKVIGIDVKHPKDYQNNWPAGSSEGLLIQGDQYYRVLANGIKEKI